MSGDGKRSAGLRPQATAPILDSTYPEGFCTAATTTAIGGYNCRVVERCRSTADDPTRTSADPIESRARPFQSGNLRRYDASHEPGPEHEAPRVRHDGRRGSGLAAGGAGAAGDAG